MTKHEQKVYDMVNDWCNNQGGKDIPDANRRYLMDQILEFAGKNSKPGRIPSIDEFMLYAKSLSPYTPEYDFSLQAKYEQWLASGWKDGYNKPIKNWKSKLMNVFPHLKKLSNNNNEQRTKFDQARDTYKQVANELLGGK